MSLFPEKRHHSYSAQCALYFCLLVALFIAYYPVLKSLFAVWMKSDEYSHGFFIIPLSVYMVWQQREVITATEPTSSWKGMAGLLAALVVYIMASLMKITTIVSVSFPLSIAALVWFLYGGKMLWVVVFPVFFLFLMIPVPEQIYSSLTIHLQILVSKYSVIIASSAGIPIFREGNVINLPGRTLEVVQACSGIRSLISLITLCLVIGYFGFKSNVLRATLVISAVPVAVLVNIVRVLLMIVAFYYFQYDLTADPVHTYLGIAIFIIALAVTMVLFKGLSLWEK